MNLRSIQDNNKIILVYIAFILIFAFSMLGPKNYQYWGFEAVSIPVIAVIGLVCLFYFFRKNLELHKAAFILIIIFGLLMVFLAPPMSFTDEGTHFTRAELLTEGVLYPEKTDSGFYVNSYYFGLNEAQKGLTVFDNPSVNTPIGDDKGYWQTTTESPFYSYLPSAFGILIAKCLNLTAIWALYFARLANLILYGVVAYFAVKKAPAFKLALALISTMPLVIAQVSSTSYDAFILTFSLVILAYFIKMFKDKVENKDLAIFLISVLLISLIKPPYIMLSLLLLAVPGDNFNNNRNYSLIGILLLFIATFLSVGGLLSSFFTAPSHTSAAASNISLTGQINYILANPLTLIDLVKYIFVSIPDVFVSDLSFYHYADFKGLKLFNLLYAIFFIGYCLFYKQDINLSKRQKTILSLLFLITYFGVFGILYLQWTPVGSKIILGIQARYFLPVLALLPLIINFKSKENYKLLLTAIVLFLVGLVMLTITHYY